MLVKHVFETNHNALKIGLAALANVVADLAQVDVIESGIDFVHDKKGSRMETVNRKEQRQGGNGFFSSTELFHVAESLHGRHGVELEASLVRFVCVV